MNRFIAICAIVILNSCNNETPDHDPEIETPHVGIDAPATITYTVLSQFPHDTSAYTQGLEFHNGKLYEGTGDFSNSTLKIYSNWKTGAVAKKHVMGTDKIFGEGITIFNNKLYQLTW